MNPNIARKPVNFKDFFSFETFQNMHVFAQTEPLEEGDAKKAWIDNYFHRIEVDYKKPFLNFLQARHENGEMKPFSNAEGYKSNFLHAWNDTVNKSGQYQQDPFDSWKTIARAFDGMNTMFWLLCRHEKIGESVKPDDHSKYEKLINEVNLGTFRWSQCDMRQQCYRTGESLLVKFDNWEGVLGKLEGDFRNSIFVPVKPEMQSDEVQHQPVILNTGNLLVADWFRIEEFTKETKMLGDFEINSEYGCKLCTKTYAKELNIVHVCVGNSSPELYFGDDGFIASSNSEEDTEPQNYHSLGNICTDLWWVTMIERENLVSIIAKSKGQEEAEKIVNSYVAENDVTSISVPPGTYHLYYDSDNRRFHNLFASDDIKFEGISKPLFILAKNELTLLPTIRETRKPKMR